jgi:hypothetical protein
MGKQETTGNSPQKVTKASKGRKGEIVEITETRGELHEIQRMAEIVSDKTKRAANLEENRETGNEN